jgi:hypothetical protein
MIQGQYIPVQIENSEYAREFRWIRGMFPKLFVAHNILSLSPIGPPFKPRRAVSLRSVLSPFQVSRLPCFISRVLLVLESMLSLSTRCDPLLIWSQNAPSLFQRRLIVPELLWRFQRMLVSLRFSDLVSGIQRSSHRSLSTIAHARFAPLNIWRVLIQHFRRPRALSGSKRALLRFISDAHAAFVATV